MRLTESQFNDCLEALFDENLDPADSEQLVNAATAFQNLAMHYVDCFAHPLLKLVQFDKIKIGIMLKRFHREAFGVKHFQELLSQFERAGELTPKCREQIVKRLRCVGIRINSSAPKKTRIAAAFSLWATTLKPVFIAKCPSIPDERTSRLDAILTFWIASRFLRQYGTIEIGDPINNVEDFKARLQRIWHDFTYRDLTLSSLEFMYAFIFKPST